MSAVLIGRFEPGSDEWHQARANGIGGSEVSAVVGLSPYDSRFSLWHRKAGHIGPVEVTEPMEAGTLLEPVIVRKFAQNHPEFDVEASATYCHPERPWQIANPDAVILHETEDSAHPDYLLETKFALYDEHWGAPGTAEIPIHYRCQVQWYLDVFGLATCYVEVFIGSQGQFREYIINADPSEQATLRDKAKEFLDSLHADQSPDIDAHTATYSAIKEMHPQIHPISVEVPADLARRFCATRAAEKIAKEQAQHATSLLADHMGICKQATHAGHTIATRQARGNGLPYVVAARNLDTLLIEQAS